MIDDLLDALVRRFAEATASGDTEGAEVWARSAFGLALRRSVTVPPDLPEADQ